jgi:hypothetical protein
MLVSLPSTTAILQGYKTVNIYNRIDQWETLVIKKRPAWHRQSAGPKCEWNIYDEVKAKQWKMRRKSTTYQHEQLGSA